MPSGLEFDFIEVDQNDEEQEEAEVSTGISQQHDATKDDNDEKASDEEFEFPLFAAPSKEEKVETGEKIAIMKVSMREDIEENIKNERPSSYYFAVYSEDDKKAFEQAAITADDLYSELRISIPAYNPKPWKCLDLNAYNASIELELARQKRRNKGCRAGKKKRTCKIECRERKLERTKIEKKLKREQQQKDKKKFFKQNSYKNFKRKAGGAPAPAAKKPKYRTE